MMELSLGIVLLDLIVGGLVAGFFAGLLGIGGGVLLVPLFLFIFPALGFPPETVAQTAVATSLAVILPTAISNTLKQRQHGNIDWPQVSWLSAGAVTGAFCGSSAATFVDGSTLQTCFGLLLVFIGLKSFVVSSPPVFRKGFSPSRLPLLGTGWVGGTLSAFLGIGGGVVTIPLLTSCFRLPLPRAIGNNCPLIAVSSLFGVLFYIFHGWALETAAPFSVGFVHLPIAFLVALVAIPASRLGVKTSIGLPHHHLHRIFAILLMLVGTRMALRAAGVFA